MKSNDSGAWHAADLFHPWYVSVVLERLESLLEQTLRPLIEADGGEIEVISADEHLIVLSLGGACSGCPGLGLTHEAVILPAIKASLGEDVELELRQGPARVLSLRPAANVDSGR